MLKGGGKEGGTKIKNRKNKKKRKNQTSSLFAVQGGGKRTKEEPKAQSGSVSPMERKENLALSEQLVTSPNY